MQYVSVIIPTFNSEKTIERAIVSAFQQGGRGVSFDIEVLICDDCSTDQTINVVRRLQGNIKCNPIFVFRNEKNSGGPNWGRNMGLRHARGEVVCFLDHDDEFTPDKIWRQLNQINKGYELVYSQCVKKME